MKVSIKDLNVSMEIKSKGIELDVYDGTKHLGDIIIDSSGITWCKGRTTKPKGKKLTWKKFIVTMNKT